MLMLANDYVCFPVISLLKYFSELIFSMGNLSIEKLQQQKPIWKEAF